MSNLEGIVSDGIHLLILYVDIPKDIENIVYVHVSKTYKKYLNTYVLLTLTGC